MRRWWGLVVAVSTLVPLSSQAQLVDVASAAGVANPDPASGGLAWLDFDHDGDLDVVVNTDTRSFLFESDGAAVPTFTDVTISHALGLGALGSEARSVVTADMNHDGWTDIVRLRIDRLEVFPNRGPSATPPFSFGDDAGLPTFVFDDDVSPFGMNAEGLGVLDVDADGFLDIVFQNDTGVRRIRNVGDGTFDFADTALDGVPTVNTTTLADGGVYGAGDYLAVADFDVDGLVDLGTRIAHGPDLYRQTGIGAFAAIDPDLPAPNANKGSIVFCDLDGDGDLDYLLSDGDPTDPGTNHVWLHDAGAFSRVDVALVATDIDGLDCGDMDNDGDLDVFVSGTGDKVVMTNTLIPTGTFGLTPVAQSGSDGDGEGVALADYDRDGDLDAMVVQDAVPNLLLRNDTNDDNYLFVRVLADVGSCASGGRILRDDVGAVVLLRATDGTVLGTREVNGGQGHGAQGTSFLHFGLASGPTTAHLVEARFQHGGAAAATLRVVPSELGAYQLLEVVSTDPDGDGILSVDEMRDAMADPDSDGDGFDAWLDPDADGDGVSDALEAGDADPCTAAVDLDGNGVLDYLQPEPLTVDGGLMIPDGGMAAMDGGGVDGGPSTRQAHGSGCMRCAVGGRDEPRPRFALLVLATAVGVRAWRRRRGTRLTI